MLQGNSTTQKTKEQILSDRLAFLAKQKPFLGKRPIGMSVENYRRERRIQNEEYKIRKSGQWLWISSDSIETIKKGLRSKAQGTYIK
jgi:hypothetical protein